MFKWFKKPEQGTVKLTFIALDEEDNPSEDIAIVPYDTEYNEDNIRAKFRNYLRITKNHLVVEITITERIINDK